MDGLLRLNLIHFLDFYFLLCFFLSTFRRIGQYRHVAKMAVSGPGRWPKLLKLVSEHRTVFMTWATIAPAVLALALSLAQLLASRLVWPDAGRPPPEGLTLDRLLYHWPVLFLAAPLGVAMVAFDIYGLIVIGEIDRPLMEKYFDQAEYWLRSPAANVVHVVTFGFINPRRMVADEVRKSLVEASNLLNTTLWRVSLQVALRIAFGLTLWMTWALSR
jgi:hypothetical protein